MCVALLALDAVVHTQGDGTSRAIPIAEFHTLPGDHPEIETALTKGELVTSVEIPRLGFSKTSAYVKARDRASYAFALASAGVALEFEGGRIRSARVALGGVSTKPWRAAETEGALVGSIPSEDAFANAAKLAANGAKTTPDNDFKRKLTERVVLAALTRAWKKS
jgi:xanthine dehydrogenase YagS FAD-binding subunit